MSKVKKLKALYHRIGSRDEARLIREKNPDKKFRTGFRRDCARLIHSSAFRRLQGKTQLFPGAESDFFRNRLTHSLEVGQVAKSIAIRLNAQEKSLRDKKNFRIDPDLCEFAGWCHDLGHPPFGHNGEEALNECLAGQGGWEGNAQTLRILTRLAKRTVPTDGDTSGISESGADERTGLNLTARSLASILKYDHQIPEDTSSGVKKGYYAEEAKIVEWIKKCIIGEESYPNKFKTIECQIMDLADDISYSTYDLEDAFHAGFLDPAKLMASPPKILQIVADRVADATENPFTSINVLDVLRYVFKDFFLDDQQRTDFDKFRQVTMKSHSLQSNGQYRTHFTSQLVGQFINSVEFEPNYDYPALSKARLPLVVHQRVEVLKHLTFVHLIESPRLRITRTRGREIVRSLFQAIKEDSTLLPDDWLATFKRISRDAGVRLIADFVGCMTDRYAIEFYGRLRSESPQTIFKPL